MFLFVGEKKRKSERVDSSLLTSRYLLTLCFLGVAGCFIRASFFFSFFLLLRGDAPPSLSLAVASRSLVSFFLSFFFSFLSFDRLIKRSDRAITLQKTAGKLPCKSYSILRTRLARNRARV